MHPSLTHYSYLNLFAHELFNKIKVCKDINHIMSSSDEPV